MANANSTPVSNKSIEAQRLLTYSGHHGKSYSGTGPELVSAGLVKLEWLPGVNGNARTATRVGMIDGEMKLLPFGKMATSAQEEDGLIHIHRASKTKFHVSVRLKKEERQRQQEQWEREARMKEIEKAHKDRDDGIACIPADHKAYVEDQVRSLDCMMSVMRDKLTRGFGYSGGYYFSQEIVDEFDTVVERLTQLLQEGRVYFNKETRGREIAKIESKFRDKNPDFSAFMATTLAIGKAATLNNLE
ncbi:hypothetical protein [Nitrosospira sp. Nsp13]|uniref:hypothetical protein n=1 Tax=Nitrosospira sp. Nsp13 TaxID=1855332 RepID=UPI0008920701|nr:hypothetical protein [Nitrosospira sp. Nsp13]SCY31184.1 hypothetical protein SAMN05216308_107109 [Nitrosospira sp. Nsp13]